MSAFDKRNTGKLQVENIPISLIDANPYQPRTVFDKEALMDLSKSILRLGVLQPISVRRISFGRYELIAGERRLRASQIAGLETIPAIILKATDHDSTVLAIVENVQRQDLNPFDEANGYQRLVTEHGYKQDEIAALVGKSQSAVANKLRLLKLPSVVQYKIMDNGLSERHARALLALDNPADVEKVLAKVLEGSLNVSQTEELVEKTNLRHAPKEKKPAQNQKMKTVFRNLKLFGNTVRQAAKILEKGGLTAQIEEIQNEQNYELRIIVPLSGQENGGENL